MAIGSRSSHEAAPAAWQRWLVPSAGDLIFVALLGLLAFTALSQRLLGDGGTGWHIRTGQLILSAHTIPHTDPFSSSMAGQPWFAWEWLYDMLVGALERTAGLNGVVAVTALFIALTFAWAFRLLLWRGTNVLLAAVLVLLAASASMIHFLARPHVLSWLFTVAWFWILESTEENCIPNPDYPLPRKDSPTRRLWLLPPLMLLWVNLHGGLLIGFALLAIYWFAAVWRWLRLKEERIESAVRKIRAAQRMGTLALSAVLSCGATFVNPYGFRLHVHIYRYLSNSFLMDHIDEFQSPNFHYVAQRCFAALLLLTLVALTAKRGKVGVTEGLVVLFAVYSGLYASRNIPVSSLLLILEIGPWLSDGMKKLAAHRHRDGEWGFLLRMQAMELSLRGHLWPLAAVVLTILIVAEDGSLGASQLMATHFDARRFPAHAVDALEARGIEGPILSTDSWGGYLIYRLYPRARVVLDDRHDLYGEEFLKSYLKMIHVEPSWYEFIERNPARCIIAPKDSALTSILSETRAWQPIYSDDVAVVFAHSPPTKSSRTSRLDKHSNRVLRSCKIVHIDSAWDSAICSARGI